MLNISQESTLRQDYKYISYNERTINNFYYFKELFDFAVDDKVDIEKIAGDFFYCEIGDADKQGDVNPVKLNLDKRTLEDENYYKKIEQGNILSAKENDILLSKVRPNLKKYIRITPENSDVFFTTAFIHLKSKIMPEIMYYCLRSVFFQNIVAVSRMGKGYPTISEKDLFYLKFDKKSIDKLYENREGLTAKILEIEKEIQEYKNNIKTSSMIIDEIFQKEFNFDYVQFNRLKSNKIFSTSIFNFSQNPDLRFSAKFHRVAGEFVMNELNNLTGKKIKDFLAEPIVLGASISPCNYDEDGEFSYISMATIKNWKYDCDSANTVSMEYSKAKSSKTVSKNDILLARSGEGTIGKVALITNDEKGIFSDFIMRIRLKNYNPKFAYYYFRTCYFQYLIEIYKKGLGNNTNIFPIVIKELPLLDISLEEQQRIVDEIHFELDKLDIINQKIEELRNEIELMLENVIEKN